MSSRPIVCRILYCGVLVAVLCGCNQAHLVSYSADGGVVGIPSNNNYWPTYNREHAEELMRQRCPNGYVIDEEKEAVVGTTQLTTTNTTRTGDPLLAALHIDPVREETHETTQYVDRKEWRIYFRKQEAAQAAKPSSLPDQPTPVAGGQ